MPTHARRRWQSILAIVLLFPGLAEVASGRDGVVSQGLEGTLAIDHKDVGCIVGDRYPRLDACFTPSGDLGNAKVLFRAGDSGPWYAIDLTPEGACHVAYLPKPLQTTTEIQYYVAAVDKSFNARQQPETAPESAYRARVVRNQGDCDRLKRVALSVRSVAKPIVVAAGRTGVAVELFFWYGQRIQRSKLLPERGAAGRAGLPMSERT